MANVLGELFQNIADAIRSKTGSTDKLKPNQFPEAIEGITTGGGSSADVRYVTFRNESTGEEYKKAVAVGDDCVDVVAKGLWKAPTKESTAQYNYTFYGWGASDNGAADANILKNITEDKTVYAIFTATVRYYTITWLDSDGVTELPGQTQWAYGSVPSYAPSKDGFIFDSWTPTPVAVTEDTTYTAKWLEGVDFATSPWSTIARISESGKAKEFFSVYDQRKIAINGKEYTFAIVGFDHDDLADGSGKAGITIMSEEIVSKCSSGVTEIYDADGFYGSRMHNTANNVIYYGMDADLKAVIKNVNKQYDYGCPCALSGASIVERSVRVWVPSFAEMGIPNFSNYPIQTLGEIYQYRPYTFMWSRNIIFDSASYNRFSQIYSGSISSVPIATEENGILVGFCI